MGQKQSQQHSQNIKVQVESKPVSHQLEAQLKAKHAFPKRPNPPKQMKNTVLLQDNSGEVVEVELPPLGRMQRTKIVVGDATSEEKLNLKQVHTLESLGAMKVLAQLYILAGNLLANPVDSVLRQERNPSKIPSMDLEAFRAHTDRFRKNLRNIDDLPIKTCLQRSTELSKKHPKAPDLDTVDASTLEFVDEYRMLAATQFMLCIETPVEFDAQNSHVYVDTQNDEKYTWSAKSQLWRSVKATAEGKKTFALKVLPKEDLDLFSFSNWKVTEKLLGGFRVTHKKMKELFQSRRGGLKKIDYR